MTIKNTYMIGKLDSIFELQESLKKAHEQFISEFIHSSFLIAHDEVGRPVVLEVDGKKYGFIFSGIDEFEKAFMDEETSYEELTVSYLKSILELCKLHGVILNVSSHNFYITREFINGLNDIPSDTIDSSRAYSQEELGMLKDSLDNSDLEGLIKSPIAFKDLIETISSRPLLSLAVSEKDMDILEEEGMIDTLGLWDKYDFYSHDQYAVLFTGKDRMKNIKTDTFRYLALTDLSIIAHNSIHRELKGIVINPDEENYIIPIEELIENWPIINQKCRNEKMVSSRRTLFVIKNN